jgi:hypothetical protein
MGWFWESKATNNDAVGKLDSKLKEFLQEGASPQPPTSTTPDRPGPPLPQPSEYAVEQTRPKVPSKSHFQDGRYAHIWKDYRPPQELDQIAKSESQKVADLVELHKKRRKDINKAALENCIEEHIALQDCISWGSWKDKMSSCHRYWVKLDHCYLYQAKFLKALGYLSVSGRTLEEEERIQMHGDKLYQQLVEQERMMEEARKDGKELPKFAPLMSPKNIAAAIRGEAGILQKEERSPYEDPNYRPEGWYMWDEERQKEHEERLKEPQFRDPLTRQLEMEEIAAEGRSHHEFSKAYWDSQVEAFEARKKRFEQGNPTLKDRFDRWWSGK